MSAIVLDAIEKISKDVRLVMMDQIECTDELKKNQQAIQNQVGNVLDAVNNFENQIIEKDLQIRDQAEVIKKKDKVIGEKDRVIEEKDNIIRQENVVIEEKDNVIKQKDKVIEEKDNIIRQKDREIVEKDAIIDRYRKTLDVYNKNRKTILAKSLDMARAIRERKDYDVIAGINDEVVGAVSQEEKEAEEAKADAEKAARVAANQRARREAFRNRVKF